ncbi:MULTISPECIES: hypothetical protein [unclassified Sporosarcina]|nr:MULTISPECIES: hypothetical protein [unclassified Sporosarcina]
MAKLNWLIVLFTLTLLTSCEIGNEIQTLTAPSPEQEVESNEQGLTFLIS